MSRPDLNNDDVLLAALSATIDDTDPPPPAAVRAAMAACEFRDVDGELAALVADSAADNLVLMRDDTDSMVLTFRAPEVTIEIEIDRDRHAVGVISPPRATDIEVETSSVHDDELARTTASDELGRFRINVGNGLSRLRVGSGPEIVVTSWFYC